MQHAACTMYMASSPRTTLLLMGVFTTGRFPSRMTPRWCRWDGFGEPSPNDHDIMRNDLRCYYLLYAPHTRACTHAQAMHQTKRARPFKLHDLPEPYHQHAIPNPPQPRLHPLEPREHRA